MDCKHQFDNCLVSTVLLPNPFGRDSKKRYETCLFFDKPKFSTVVATYSSAATAHTGHARWCHDIQTGVISWRDYANV